MKQFAVWELPEGYHIWRTVRLAEERETLKKLAVGQILLYGVLIGLGIWHCPLKAAFSMGAGRAAAGLFFMFLGLFVYILAHEWVHGVFIRLFSDQPADFGMKLSRGMAYAGSKAYFTKVPYLIIALSPLAVWTVILWMLLRDIPAGWFWYLYVIQIVNVGGAVGDLYVAWLTLKAPEGTLIRDSGTDMIFYAP